MVLNSIGISPKGEEQLDRFDFPQPASIHEGGRSSPPVRAFTSTPLARKMYSSGSGVAIDCSIMQWQCLGIVQKFGFLDRDECGGKKQKKKRERRGCAFRRYTAGVCPRTESERPSI